MSELDKIEQEMRNYLEVSKNLSSEERKKRLGELFDRNFIMDNNEHKIKAKDLHDIISMAKMLWTQTALPMRVTGYQLEPYEVNHAVLIEALVGYLNRNRLLRHLVKFDKTR